MKPNTENEEANDSYLAGKITSMLEACSIREKGREGKVTEACKRGAASMAEVTAQETEDHRQLKDLYEVLLEEIEVLEDRVGALTPAELDPNMKQLSDRLSVYRKLKPSLERAVENQETVMYNLRLKYLELKAESASKTELQELLSLWTSRAQLQDVEPNVRSHALNCKKVCEAAVKKRAPDHTV